jgi:uracil-DNA glycosylase
MATAVTAEQELQDTREQAARCRRCPLWEPATQTVFGEGPVSARMLLVGEQPGDREDLEGPAGGVLDRALAAAKIDRTDVYLTNAVKHFKFQQRGKRRIHAKPGTGEIEACHPWLDAELLLVDPAVVVLMGTVAVRSVLGPGHTLKSLRGGPLDLLPGRTTVVTTHPSSVLRTPDPDAREAAFAGLVDDLRLARRQSRGPAATSTGRAAKT